MPGRNGTGPRGMGPMTGCGAGCCGRRIRGGWHGMGYSRQYAENPNQDPAQEKERLAGLEQSLTGQLAEVKRLQSQLDGAAEEE